MDTQVKTDTTDITANVTVIAMTWYRDIYRLDNLLWTLTKQSAPPMKIIIVNQTPGGIYCSAVSRVCHDYDVDCPLEPRTEFSMPVAFNRALDITDTDYVMFTGVDMMFSERFIEVLMGKLDDNSFVNAMMGYFPKMFFMGNDNFFANWDRIIKLCDPKSITRALSPGACQAMPTNWIKSVNGYDERYSGGLGGIDDEMRTRAIKAGLDIKWIEWDEAQVVHQWHDKSPLKGVTSHLFDADPDIIANTKLEG